VRVHIVGVGHDVVYSSFRLGDDSASSVSSCQGSGSPRRLSEIPEEEDHSGSGVVLIHEDFDTGVHTMDESLPASASSGRKAAKNALSLPPCFSSDDEILTYSHRMIAD